MLSEKELINLFKTDILPIKDWDGRPGYYSNQKKYNLNFSQKFGQSLLDYSQFGLKGHNGIDIGGLKGTPIVAPCKLWISTAQNKDVGGYGLYVVGETETQKINGDYYKMEMVFGHFKSVSAVAGKWCQKGDELGLMNSTGFSTGNHLHFGIRPLWSKDGNTWEKMFKDNGFSGYIDPEPLLPHIVWDLNEILNPKVGVGIYKPKSYKQAYSKARGWHWEPIK